MTTFEAALDKYRKHVRANAIHEERKGPQTSEGGELDRLEEKARTAVYLARLEEQPTPATSTADHCTECGEESPLTACEPCLTSAQEDERVTEALRRASRWLAVGLSKRIEVGRAAPNDLERTLSLVESLIDETGNNPPDRDIVHARMVYPCPDCDISTDGPRHPCAKPCEPFTGETVRMYRGTAVRAPSAPEGGYGYIPTPPD